jgi:hypothetical protein
MKLHHFRKEWHELVQGKTVRRLLTYCGQAWFSDKPDGTEFESAPHAPETYAPEHCRRCLQSKRIAKGDRYMVAHGLPLLVHPLEDHVLRKDRW